MCLKDVRTKLNGYYHPLNKEKNMKIRTIVNRIFQVGVLAALVTGCGYNDDLVDPDDPVTPLLSLSGNLSDGFSENLSSLSPRIGIVPINSTLFSNNMEDEKYARYIIEEMDLFEDSITSTYPAVTFNGKFPMNFSADLAQLPNQRDVQPYRSPSGKIAKIGVYSIILFDDVNKDGLLRFVVKIDSLSGEAFFSGTSDTLLGLCREYLLIYLENSAIIPELNAYIAEHIGAAAQWDQLGDGYNLVKVNQTATLQVPFNGVKLMPAGTQIRLEPGVKDPEMANQTILDIDNVFTTALSLFHFQRNYNLMDYAGVTVVPREGATNIYLKSNSGTLIAGLMSEEGTTPAAQKPKLHVNSGREFSSYLGIFLTAVGVFDKGYIDRSHPLGVFDLENEQFLSRFTVNGKMLNNSDTLVTRYDNYADTVSGTNLVMVESDTISIDFPMSGSDENGGALKPRYVHLIGASLFDKGRYTVTADSVENAYTSVPE